MFVIIDYKKKKSGLQGAHLEIINRNNVKILEKGDK